MKNLLRFLKSLRLRERLMDIARLPVYALVAWALVQANRATAKEKEPT